LKHIGVESKSGLISREARGWGKEEIIGEKLSNRRRKKKIQLRGLKAKTSVFTFRAGKFTPELKTLVGMEKADAENLNSQ